MQTVGVHIKMTKSEIKYFPNGSIQLQYETLDGERHGKFVRFHENGQKAIECQYAFGKHDGLCREWYSNGQIAEEGTYLEGEYIPINFWTEIGEQTLIDGTGKVIRNFGANDHLLVEQYFEQGEYQGDKKLTEVQYGKFKNK